LDLINVHVWWFWDGPSYERVFPHYAMSITDSRWRARRRPWSFVRTVSDVVCYNNQERGLFGSFLPCWLCPAPTYGSNNQSTTIIWICVHRPIHSISRVYISIARSPSYEYYTASIIHISIGTNKMDNWSFSSLMTAVTFFAHSKYSLANYVSKARLPFERWWIM
jgi:hypothetical protein